MSCRTGAIRPGWGGAGLWFDQRAPAGAPACEVSVHVYPDPGLLLPGGFSVVATALLCPQTLSALGVGEKRRGRMLEGTPCVAQGACQMHQVLCPAPELHGGPRMASLSWGAVRRNREHLFSESSWDALGGFPTQLRDLATSSDP